MKKLVTFAVMATLITGCATDDPNQKAKLGAAIGAVTGAVLGHAVENDKRWSDCGCRSIESSRSGYWSLYG
ncbi:MAG: hypothetical protein Q9N32_05655 [Gammaproteobacteria bacterium]|nr:hypothetical protein [Gammaproteobacteria bacterium]